MVFLLILRMLNGKVAKAAAESIVPFYCFEEDWERDVIVTKCNTNQHKLRIKYCGICFQDDDVEKVDNKNKKFRVTEVRKVVNVEWSSKQRPSQHVLVTQLVNSDIIKIRLSLIGLTKPFSK